MAHLEQMAFCASVKQRYPAFFKTKMVLDIGSLDINGNNQYLFENSIYLGVDVGPGRNVDIICKAHELALPSHTFDVIISTSTLEHDRYYQQTLLNAYRLLKPGGLMLLTIAGDGHGEHGTRRTTPGDAPLLLAHGDWADYYKNLSADDIRRVFDLNALFQMHELIYNPGPRDLYFCGFKIGAFIARNDYSICCRIGAV